MTDADVLPDVVRHGTLIVPDARPEVIWQQSLVDDCE